MQTATPGHGDVSAAAAGSVDGLAEGPFVLTEEQLALLERFKPILRIDRQYDYKPASVLGAVESRGNLLRTGHGELVARAGHEPGLSVALLATYAL
jgi:hypothetical protein